MDHSRRKAACNPPSQAAAGVFLELDAPAAVPAAVLLAGHGALATQRGADFDCKCQCAAACPRWLPSAVAEP